MKPSAPPKLLGSPLETKTRSAAGAGGVDPTPVHRDQAVAATRAATPDHQGAVVQDLALAQEVARAQGHDRLVVRRRKVVARLLVQSPAAAVAVVVVAPVGASVEAGVGRAVLLSLEGRRGEGVAAQVARLRQREIGRGKAGRWSGIEERGVWSRRRSLSDHTLELGN